MSARSHLRYSHSKMSTAAPLNDLVSPVPQRAYAFMALFETSDATTRPQTVPWGAVGGLIRPSSAPAGFSHPNASMPELTAAAPPPPPAHPVHIERPVSPPSRVANPMVRDRHFRRVGMGIEKMSTRSSDSDNEKR